MDRTPLEPQIQKENALLKDFSSKSRSLSSSIDRLSGSSRAIPCDKDFHFYFNFEEFKDPIQETARNSQSILESIGSSAERLWGGKNMAFPKVDIDDDEAYQWLVNVNDELLERFDASIDEFKKLRNKEEETGTRVMGLVDDDGFQLVTGKKKKASQKDLLVAGDNNSGSSSSVKVVSRDSITMGTQKAKIPFHIASIRRPQEEYKILVNNANQPFEHVWLQKSEDGTRFIHPLDNYSITDFVDKYVSDVEPVKPLPVESTSFKLVEEVKDLKELAAKLRAANEFAVDLEHNQYRSFQGLTCLMQISTRTEDFIVDTLKLRIHIGPYLREVFKDPTKRKVMHGADRDIIWLQRDFGIYVCNLFDTGQASRVLKLERNSLEHLLQYFCGVAANKAYQNADWRLRPLTDEMLRYAREDTHYLLYIYDLMKRRLLLSSTDPGCPEALLLDVYQRSCHICMQLYQKEVLTETSYLNIYGLAAADLSAQQLSVVASLCEWRDVIARAEDESTGYILPNKVLIEIAKQMPVTTSKLRRMLKARLPYIDRNLGAIVSIIRHSMQGGAAFEDAAKKLKEERMQMEAARIAKSTNGEEELQDEEASRDCSIEKVDDAIQFEDEVGSFISAVNRNNTTVRSSEHVKSDRNVTNSFGEMNMNLSQPAFRASIQVQKKPSSAFGALLGYAAGKRKFDLATKATEEIKVEQIKASVNLPFHSFTGKTEPMLKESAAAQETSFCEEPSNVLPATRSSEPKDEDVILLDSDSDRGEEKVEIASGSRAADNEMSEDQNEVILLDSDSDPGQANQGEDIDEEEPMSLSDLSNSFRKCLQTTNEMKKSTQNDKGDGGLLKVKPFDYAAASKEFLEEAGSEEECVTTGKADRKKAAGSGKNSAGAERSGEFQPGKRRQAFPATGNRSATFR